MGLGGGGHGSINTIPTLVFVFTLLVTGILVVRKVRGGILIGLVEALAGAYLGGEYKLLATFMVLVVILMARPYGLFGTHEIERL